MPISTIGSNSLNQTSDLTINGVTVGKGGGAVSTNTAVGASALAANTAGTRNTAVGSTAASGVTGSRIVAIGDNVLATSTSGNDNVAIGDYTMRAYTGSSSTAVGAQAMANSTSNSGDNNTAVGAGALNGNAGGASNTAVGASALEANTTASNNTAVGYRAGYAITTQSNNIYIGYSCGSSQTGSGGIFIGANAFSGYNGNNQVAFKTGDGREALYADINAGASFRQYSNSSSWATVSDQRVKENIVGITDGLEKIVALRPVTFDYITSKEHNAGFIAQEFQTVLPDQVKLVKARPEEAELVGEDEIYSIQQNLVPYLVKAIQELKTIVDAQAAEIAELKAKVA